jgi:hypothetical protein
MESGLIHRQGFYYVRRLLKTKSNLVGAPHGVEIKVKQFLYRPGQTLKGFRRVRLPVLMKIVI